MNQTCENCHYRDEDYRPESCANMPTNFCENWAGDEAADLKAELAAARGANLVLDERAAGLVRALENAIFNFRNETCGHGSQCVLGEGCNDDACCVHAWVAALDKYREGME